MNPLLLTRKHMTSTLWLSQKRTEEASHYLFYYIVENTIT